MKGEKDMNSPTPRRPPHFRRAVLRGLGVVMPPLLTIVIFLWIGSTVDGYVLGPVTRGVRDLLVWSVADVRTKLPEAQPTTEPGVFRSRERLFQRLEDGTYVPQEVVERVQRDTGRELPLTGRKMYERWVELRYLNRYVVVPLFLVIFLLVMYLLGRFMAAGIGRVFWNLFERGINRLPLISNVYSSVKQVTDFMFNETEFQINRVVAVEYPRKGIWSLGFVTGESFMDIHEAAGEPVLAVLIPTSPMPVTGYTVNVLKRETIDLNISFDQACQFIISCGVVVPPHQLPRGFGSTPSLPGAAPRRLDDQDSPERAALTAP